MNPMDVQTQIRHNAMEMQSAFKDLANWEKTVKKKDKKIRKAVRAPVRSGGTISVRSGAVGAVQDLEKLKQKKAKREEKDQKRAEKEAKKAEERAKREQIKKSGADHTYDKGYDKWKKFDIDAACDEVDKKDEASSESSSDSSDDDGPAMHPALRAAPKSVIKHIKRGGSSANVRGAGAAVDSESREQIEREQGNAHYKKGEFQEAIKCYTRCIGINPRSTIALSNRAMTYLKMKEFGKAELDCTNALRVDKFHVKSFQRRGTALNGLGRHLASLKDFSRALEIDPNNRQAKTEVRKSRELMKTAIRRAPREKISITLLQDGENPREVFAGPMKPTANPSGVKATGDVAKKVSIQVADDDDDDSSGSSSSDDEGEDVKVNVNVTEAPPQPNLSPADLVDQQGQQGGGECS